MADVGPLKEAFRAGLDIHALTASQVFGVPVEGMDPMVRRRAKAINFGILYGINAFGLAAQLCIPQGEPKAHTAASLPRFPGPLKEAFRAGLDIHALTASQVFGVPVEGMDPMVRRRAKAINFGIIYGISAFGLAAQLGIPQGEAKAYIEAYFARFPGIRDYMDKTKKFAREHGYVTTLFGRRCHVPGINDKNPARKSFMERAAINAPLQGTAADIIKRAMIRVPPALAEAGLAARMLQIGRASCRARVCQYV